MEHQVHQVHQSGDAIASFPGSAHTLESGNEASDAIKSNVRIARAEPHGTLVSQATPLWKGYACQTGI